MKADKLKARFFAATTAAALAALVAIAPAAAQIPDVRVEDSRGEAVSTSILAAKGKPLIVSFWSTTCKPCLVELGAMHDALDDWRAEADFEVVAVSVDDQRSASVARALVDSRGWGDGFTVLYDKNQEFKRALNVNAIPHTFIFDAAGEVVYSHVGYTPGTEEEYIERIKASQPK